MPEWIQNVSKIQNHFLRSAVVNKNTNLKILRIVWRRVLEEREGRKFLSSARLESSLDLKEDAPSCLCVLSEATKSLACSFFSGNLLER